MTKNNAQYGPTAEGGDKTRLDIVRQDTWQGSRSRGKSQGMV